MGEKNPMGFFSYFERFIHETFRNIIFYEMMNNYDILMRLVVFKKKKKSHGIFKIPWDFFSHGIFSNGIFQFRKPNKFLNAKNNNKGNNNYNFE
jgi:hypothetical protein